MTAAHSAGRHAIAEPWAILLAGGEGARVRDLTRDEAGRPAPKQFCRIRGHKTLLERALDRARSVTQDARILPLVQASHAQWWQPGLAGFPPDNVVQEPGNRGTGLAILRGVLRILSRDPEATIVILPTDHGAEDEDALCDAIGQTAEAAAEWPRHTILLGMPPGGSHTDYGWIVPSRAARFGTAAVAGFYEKPDPNIARRLARSGALINAFILAGTGPALLGLYSFALPELLLTGFASELDSVFDCSFDLAYRDFSRDVLERSTNHLRVLRAPACGWSDLGTPDRLRDWLERHEEALAV